MPTIVYLVHGMGCGSEDGSPVPAASAWSAEVRRALDWVTGTFGLPPVTWLDPVPATAPNTASDAVWAVPISYHQVFDTFRAGAQDRAQAVRGVASALSDAQIARLTGTPFLWKNCLDVLLWWSDVAQARPHATSAIINAITAVDALARATPGATVRRILISHSLGTAATTYALRYLGNSPEWRTRGFDLFMTLANVAPFLLDEPTVYSPPLVPRSTDTVVRTFVNVRNDADPVPWLLPWRHFDPSNDPASAPLWATATNAGRARTLATAGVASPPADTPQISDVHGFSNYLMAQGVAELVAGAMRGAYFAPTELAARNWPAAWSALPQLSCTKTPTALGDLLNDVATYMGFPPPGGGRPATGWFDRLIGAADILVAASGKCQ